LALIQLKYELGVLATLWIMWIGKWEEETERMEPEPYFRAHLSVPILTDRSLSAAAAADATSAFTYFMSYCGRYFLDENGEIYFSEFPSRAEEREEKKRRTAEHVPFPCSVPTFISSWTSLL